MYNGYSQSEEDRYYEYMMEQDRQYEEELYQLWSELMHQLQTIQFVGL